MKICPSDIFSNGSIEKIEFSIYCYLNNLILPSLNPINLNKLWTFQIHHQQIDLPQYQES